MKRGEAARRWAQALFNLEKSPESVESRFSLVKSHPELAKFLRDPHIPTEVKERVLAKLFDKDPMILRFLKLLLRRGRLPLLEQISSEYTRLVKRRLGIKEVELQTAVPISETLKTRLSTNLQKDLNREVALLSEVDPKLLGGALVAVENRRVDGTLKGRLDRLKEKLMELT